MENILVYDVIEIVNSVAEMLIIAFFFHRIFAAKYSSGVAYFTGYSAALAVLLVSTLNVDSPYIRIGITFIILLSIVSILYIGSYTLKFFSAVYFLLIFFIYETLLISGSLYIPAAFIKTKSKVSRSNIGCLLF